MIIIYTTAGYLQQIIRQVSTYPDADTLVVLAVVAVELAAADADNLQEESASHVPDDVELANAVVVVG